MTKKATNRALLLLDKLIGVYQITISPDHGIFRALFPGGVCIYQPTCSGYAQQAIRKHGWRGLLLAACRLSRCHVFSKGGCDPVPEIIN